jgi:hypothetical protein
VAIVIPDRVEVRNTTLILEGNTMTNPTVALAELHEKGSDLDVLREMVQFMAQRLMDIDVEGRCGAGYDEKSRVGPLHGPIRAPFSFAACKPVRTTAG